jgi:hypothetical protein
MRCKDCSRLRGRPYKRSHLVALRITKISASDPPSTSWPGKREGKGPRQQDVLILWPHSMFARRTRI